MTGELNTSQQENRALTQHSLTAIKVMAATVERSQAGAMVARADIKQSTDAIISVCDHLMTVVCSMMHQLYTLVLTELGLKATMDDLLNHWALSRNPSVFKKTKFSLS